MLSWVVMDVELAGEQDVAILENILLGSARRSSSRLYIIEDTWMHAT